MSLMPGYRPIALVSVTAVTANQSVGVVLDTAETQNAVLAAVLATAITEKCGFDRSESKISYVIVI